MERWFCDGCKRRIPDICDAESFDLEIWMPMYVWLCASCTERMYAFGRKLVEEFVRADAYVEHLSVEGQESFCDICGRESDGLDEIEVGDLEDVAVCGQHLRAINRRRREFFQTLAQPPSVDAVRERTDQAV